MSVIEQLEQELKLLSEAYVQRLDYRQCGDCNSSIGDGDTHREGCKFAEVEAKAIKRVRPGS